MLQLNDPFEGSFPDPSFREITNPRAILGLPLKPFTTVTVLAPWPGAVSPPPPACICAQGAPMTR